MSIMLILDLNATLIWTATGAIAALIGTFFALLTVLRNKHKKDESLKRACNDLCESVSIGQINALLNNVIFVCINQKIDSNTFIGIQNKLQSINQEVNAKWNETILLLDSSKAVRISKKLTEIIQEYKFCIRDVETVVAILLCNNKDDVEKCVSTNNSSEMRNIIESTKLLSLDIYEFVYHIIVLRFKDLVIPDFAQQIRLLFEDDNNGILLSVHLYAVMGNALAQNTVAEHYYKQNKYKEAFYWYYKSAKQGYRIAQFNLGLCYEKGVGVEKDESEAFMWYKKSAEQGLAEAQNSLGMCYLEGLGTKKNEKAAFEWFMKAAINEFAEAQLNTGVCYYKGEGVKKDGKKAFKWFKTAAEHGNIGAKSNLGVCYINGVGVDKDEKMAFTLFMIAATQGYAPAQKDIGECYITGTGVEKNDKEAFMWYKKSAEQGLAEAQNSLGMCYLEGLGTKKNEKAAFEWFMKAAINGVPEAQLNIGLCYQKGIGCNKSFKEAYFWFFKATENKKNIVLYRRAIFRIGFMYFNGMISGGNYLECFLCAAQYGDDFAQNMLGYCYEKGRGMKNSDIEMAKYWYGEAAKQNNKEAIENLARLNK